MKRYAKLVGLVAVLAVGYFAAAAGPSPIVDLVKDIKAEILFLNGNGGNHQLAFTTVLNGSSIPGPIEAPDNGYGIKATGDIRITYRVPGQAAQHITQTITDSQVHWYTITLPVSGPVDVVASYHITFTVEGNTINTNASEHYSVP